MTIPLYSILLLWGLFVGLLLLLSLINLFHILHYGFFSFTSALFIFLFYGVVALILLWTYQNLGSWDWHQPLFTIGPWNLNLPTTL